MANSTSYAHYEDGVPLMADHDAPAERERSEEGRKSRGSATAVQWLTLAMAMGAVAVGIVALVEVKNNKPSPAPPTSDPKSFTPAATAPVNNHMFVMQKAATQAARLTTSHPWCKASSAEWKTCMQMVDAYDDITAAHASLGNTAVAVDTLHELVANDTFGNQNSVAVLTHDGNGQILSADSLITNISFSDSTTASVVANVTHCQHNASAVCFACIPVPLSAYVCLPILHMNITIPASPSSSLSNGGNTRRESPSENPTFTYVAILGSPQRSYRSTARAGESASWSGHDSVEGAHGSASGSATAHVTLGSVTASASNVHTNLGNGGWSDTASETATASLGHGSASANGNAQLNLGDGVDVDATGKGAAHVNLGTISESAHATHGEQNGQYSGNVGASVRASASAGISAHGNLGVDTRFGDVNLASGGASAHAGAHAGASAHAQGSIGDQGVSGNFGAHAGAGVSANAGGHYSLLGGLISGSAHVGASAGPEAGFSGGAHATDRDGVISLGASGDVAAALGLHGDANINIDTGAIGEDISNGVSAIGQDIAGVFGGSAAPAAGADSAPQGGGDYGGGDSND